VAKRSRLLEQRVEASSDHGIAARPGLKDYLTTNRLACEIAIGMKVRGAMIALDDRDRPTTL